MPETRALPTGQGWDALVARADAQIREDIRKDPDGRTEHPPRYYHLTDADDHYVVARTTAVTRMDVFVARRLMPFTVLATIGLFMASVGFLPDKEGGASGWFVALVLGLCLGGSLVAFSLINAMYDKLIHPIQQRVFLRVTGRTPESYMYSARLEAISALKAATSTRPEAVRLLEALRRTTEGTEDLLMESSHLQDARRRARYSSTELIDVDDLQQRARAIDEQLTHVTALHLAAAWLISTSNDSKPGISAPVRVKSLLTEHSQERLAEALQALDAAARELSSANA